MLKQRRVRIGIITGTGPHAGIDLWNKILFLNRMFLGSEFKGDIDNPEIYIYSLPDLGMSTELSKHENFVWKILKAASKSLEIQVDFFVIACNTLHYFSESILSLNLKADFISIGDVLNEYLTDSKIEQFALLGINSVAKVNKYFPYKNLMDRYEIEKLSFNVIDRLHHLSLNIKRNGINNSLKEEMLNIINLVKSRNCILACTEFPLLNVSNSEKNIVDLNQLLAKKIVTQLNNKN